MKLINRLKYNLPALIVASAIFFASHQPDISIPDIGFGLTDKFLHLVAYFVFGITLIVAFRGNFINLGSKKLVILVFFLGAVYAFSDEIHQYYIPGRDADFFDWLADITGITLSSLLSLKSRTPGLHG